ncbi:glycosyltransferase [Oceanicoccus sagamiensis]|uniref:Glycosyltransferase n=1 Tax=Oceanicoccus sagamiensis TaxID=716816 RepID=A0A1X9NJ69_9GAMM|nr:glycosyltransferase [Oceanicoccus sagamiensis]ARN74937.1 hypothetical protein BST96_12925 [Oceanicoccus sagamiensis]
MIIIVYSEENEDSIKDNLGAPAYSYYFVLKSFLPALEQLGKVMVVEKPQDADEIYAKANGEHCVFLSFTAPHETEINLKCPTIPVFAWEFYNIPDEFWDGDISNDWRFVLGKLGWAITHSRFTVESVQTAVRVDYPVISVPAPVWDGYAPESAAEIGQVVDNFSLAVEGLSFDSRDCAVDDHLNGGELSKAISNEARQFDITGITYTTIFNPIDGRKNWPELMWAFCWAFKEQENATLILKLAAHRADDMVDALLSDLSRATPFKCRVIVIAGYLDQVNYDVLLNNTTYIVNASRGEGQCLPLMEYMARGKPAIAPKHTGMEDYIDESAAFIVRTSLEPSHWPHDPRHSYRTLRHRINWESLIEAYEASYQVAVNDQQTYASMGRRASEILEQHCSLRVTVDKLRAFFDDHRTMSERYKQRRNTG